MFEPFSIVVFESVNCLQCEKMDIKIIQSLLERVPMSKIVWKNNFRDLEDLSEEHRAV